MILEIVLVFSLLLNIVIGYVLFRFSRRLLQFDEFFELLFHDIDVNIRYFEKLLSTPLFENSQEVRTANNNMNIISQRLAEFSKQMEEIGNRKLNQEPPVGKPPVVI